MAARATGPPDLHLPSHPDRPRILRHDLDCEVLQPFDLSWVWRDLDGDVERGAILRREDLLPYEVHQALIDADPNLLASLYESVLHVRVEIIDARGDQATSKVQIRPQVDPSPPELADAGP